MDEKSLRAMLDQAVAERPETPRLVPDSVRAGVRLRKRRRIEAAVGSIAAVAIIAAVVPAVAGSPGRPAAPPAVSGGQGSARIAYVWTGTNTVTPIRLGTGKVLTPLSVPGTVQDIDAAPNGKSVYVFSNTEPNSNSGPPISYVTRISSATGKASTIRLTGNGRVTSISDVQIAPSGKVAYATEIGTWPANAKYGGWALVAINLSTGAQRKLLNTGSFGCVITPNGRTAYLGGIASGVAAVNLATDTVLPIIKVHSSGPVWGVAMAPGGKTVYAVRGDIVTPISTATNVAGSPIQVQYTGSIPDIAIAPDGQTGYLSGVEDVSPFSLVTGRALQPIKLPSSFANYGVLFQISPDSEFGYEYQPRATSVQLINLDSGRLLRPVALPGGYRQSSLGVFRGGSAAYVPASIYRAGKPSFGALFPLDLATQRLGKPILFSGVPNAVVLVP